MFECTDFRYGSQNGKPVSRIAKQRALFRNALARKKLENWLVWILVDAVAAALYFYKGMYPTVVLYIIFAVIALFGYLRWKKDLK